MGRRACLLALVAGVLASCASAERDDSHVTWPSADSAAFQWVSIFTEQHDVVLSFALTPVRQVREGVLVREGFLSIVDRRSSLPGAQMLGDYRLDDSEVQYGGSHDIGVTIRPREGLTWGDVAEEEDVDLEVTRGG